MEATLQDPQNTPAWGDAGRPPWRTKKELITAFERGNPSAFEEILVRHVELLSRHWLRAAARHGKKGSISEEALTILFDGLKAKISSSAFSYWVNSTAAAAAIDFFRGVRPSRTGSQNGCRGRERRPHFPQGTGSCKS